MQTRLRFSINTLISVAIIGLPAASVSHADRAMHADHTHLSSTADEHYLLYQQLLCNCPSTHNASLVQWSDDNTLQGEWQ